MTRDPQAGFTLIEALVAMAILATSAVSLLAAVEAHIGRIGDLERRTAARWVAENALAAQTVGQPVAREQSMLGFDWRVEVTQQGTQDPDLARTDIAVSDAADNGTGSALVRMTGFLDTREVVR